jgi:hypothetical protein
MPLISPSGTVSLLLSSGIPNRAKEEYEKVLILNPLNEYALTRLKELSDR